MANTNFPASNKKALTPVADADRVFRWHEYASHQLAEALQQIMPKGDGNYKSTLVMPDSMSLPRTPIRGHPCRRVHWIADQVRNDNLWHLVLL